MSLDLLNLDRGIQTHALIKPNVELNLRAYEVTAKIVSPGRQFAASAASQFLFVHRIAS
jgi:hypothetical protein